MTSATSRPVSATAAPVLGAETAPSAHTATSLVIEDAPVSILKFKNTMFLKTEL